MICWRNQPQEFDGIPLNQYKIWQEKYENIDVLSELEKIKNWMVKTHYNSDKLDCKDFIERWFSKSNQSRRSGFGFKSHY